MDRQTEMQWLICAERSSCFRA